MHDHLQVFTAIGLGLGLAVAVVQSAVAQQNPVTAIDIALEPDATMVQHAMAANARLLKPSRRALLWMRRTIRTSLCCSSSSVRTNSTRYL
jgi:hypothetical protein